jgi:hypothetical protein
MDITEVRYPCLLKFFEVLMKFINAFSITSSSLEFFAFQISGLNLSIQVR